MHITELTNELIEELREYIEVNSEGHIITKKENITPGGIGVCGGTRAKAGARRGRRTSLKHTASKTLV